jgi:hypothetical protein
LFSGVSFLIFRASGREEHYTQNSRKQFPGRVLFFKLFIISLDPRFDTTVAMFSKGVNQTGYDFWNWGLLWR